MVLFKVFRYPTTPQITTRSVPTKAAPTKSLDDSRRTSFHRSLPDTAGTRSTRKRSSDRTGTSIPLTPRSSSSCLQHRRTPDPSLDGPRDNEEVYGDWMGSTSRSRLSSLPGIYDGELPSSFNVTSPTLSPFLFLTREKTEGRRCTGVYVPLTEFSVQ